MDSVTVKISQVQESHSPHAYLQVDEETLRLLVVTVNQSPHISRTRADYLVKHFNCARETLKMLKENREKHV